MCSLLSSHRAAQSSRAQEESVCAQDMEYQPLRVEEQAQSVGATRRLLDALQDHTARRESDEDPLSASDRDGSQRRGRVSRGGDDKLGAHMVPGLSMDHLSVSQVLWPHWLAFPGRLQ